MRIRLEPHDEYMHPLEEAENFNESMYFNFYDPRIDLGGWFRLGNRPNEGYAEMTVCLYLQGGAVGFMYARPPIASNDAFDAGGLRFEVVRPFRELRVQYRGTVLLLADPLVMADPRRAFAQSPTTGCEVDFTYRGLSPMLGGEPEGLRDGESMPFARGHYEQHVGARGCVKVGDEAYEVDGYGLRDHSWGPRSWQAPLWYRWLTCNAGAEHGFMVSIIAGRDGSVRRSGVIFEEGGYTPILDASLETEWTERFDQKALRCVVRTPDREIDISGRVKSFIPLRNRRDGKVTRIGEGLTEYRWEGRTGYGLSEYLDQIEDGRPAGV